MGRMVNAIIAAFFVGVILFISEYLWHKTHLKGEFARKFVHIVAGSYIAFFPLWLSYGWIMVLAVAFVAVNLLNRYSTIFHSIHAIKRKTWGDILFGVGVFLCASLRPEPWLFVTAILHVSLADGLAAVVGSRFGKHHYKIFDHVKTPIGSFTFFITSMLIVLVIGVAAGELSNFSVPAMLIFLPITATLLENVSGFGTDNITLPIAVLLISNAFRIA